MRKTSLTKARVTIRPDLPHPAAAPFALLRLQTREKIRKISDVSFTRQNLNSSSYFISQRNTINFLIHVFRAAPISQWASIELWIFVLSLKGQRTFDEHFYQISKKIKDTRGLDDAPFKYFQTKILEHFRSSTKRGFYYFFLFLFNALNAGIIIS